jgi:hypothetical protein
MCASLRTIMLRQIDGLVALSAMASTDSIRFVTSESYRLSNPA